MVAGGDASPHGAVAQGGVAEIQRARILDAVVAVVAERGVAGASVGLVCARAKVSRRTFYDQFSDFEDCFIAVLDDGTERMAGVMSDAFAGERDWLDGVLAAEAAVLSYLDSDPVFARVLLVEALGGGTWALERRERNVGMLRELILAHLPNAVLESSSSPLAAVGVMESLLGIMRGHLVRGDPRPLISLLGPLMGTIVGPFMDDEGIAREVRRGNELAREMLARRSSGARGADLSVSVPDVLLSARARRARLCLLYVAEQGQRGIGPSSQQVAVGIGLAHRRQVLGALGKLVALGLLVKHAGGAGYPNAWSLTTSGEHVALALARQR